MLARTFLRSWLKSSEYSVPVLGLIFLRYADHKFSKAQAKFSSEGPAGAMPRRTTGKADYQAHDVLYLPEAARFSNLLKQPEGSDIGKAINDAMKAIEADNDDLRDVLPRPTPSSTRNDPRFPFGLPKPDNANYLWIQIFYSALTANGRAGFVMANSAGDARGSELEIRKQLLEDRAVDMMVSGGPNFFYTVTLPCTLW